jgi:hypothetical protein
MIEGDTNLNSETNENNAFIRSHAYVSQLDFAQVDSHLAMMEGCVTQIRMFIAQDPRKRKELYIVREKEAKERAKLEKDTSTRPAAKVNEPADFNEVTLAEFMRLNGITERKIGLKKKRERDNAIQGFMKNGLSEQQAQAIVDQFRDSTSKKG